MQLRLAALVATLFIAVSPAAFGQQKFLDPPLVTTSGIAEIRVVSDLADLFFTVEVRNGDLAIARRQQTERIAKVLEVIHAAGVKAAELQTSQVQINPNYTEGRSETERARFFSVWQSVAFTLHDLKKIPDVTAGAINAGATSTGSCTLRTSKLRMYRDEARANATRAAKEKAEALASQLGVKIGKPYSIEESPEYDWSRMGNSLQNGTSNGGNPTGDESSATFAPGTISISATIKVAFLIE